MRLLLRSRIGDDQPSFGNIMEIEPCCIKTT